MNNGRYPVVGTDGVSVTTNSSSGRYQTTGTYNFYDVYKSHPSFVSWSRICKFDTGSAAMEKINPATTANDNRSLQPCGSSKG